MNPFRDHVGPVVITFCYPDYTVGLGITPSHAPCSNDLSLYYKGSWALPPIGNSLALYIFAVQVSPCPEG
jgi:hypothetical protein